MQNYKTRPIKFRVWNIEKKEMVKSNSLTFHEYVTIEDQFADDEYVFTQYIGVNDSVGNEIYEGDIVSVSNDDYHETALHEVVYGSRVDNYPAFYLKGFDSDSNSFCEIFDSGNYTCVVIGNVFENYELLTQ
jgi:uncharacterized phage protein (TIGR01671 family)